MSINEIVLKDLCIQCGICVAICPNGAIEIKKNNYNYVAKINEKCINCGLCSKICNINSIVNFDINKPLEQQILGNICKIYKAKTKNKEILMKSTSGGVITTLISNLLKNDDYDLAFCLNDYSYEEQLQTYPVENDFDLTKTPKSRYLTVTHTKSMEFIKYNPNKRVILTATGCVITNILNFIKINKLKRENYLLLGLFCDKTMNYGVVEYFRQYLLNKENKEIKLFYFRSKNNSPWPGGMEFITKDGSRIYLDRNERIKIKDFFIPKRCHFCINKLNFNSDISFGDNYVPQNKDIEGISSIIIRTSKGMKVWEKYKDNFIYEQENIQQIIDSQNLNQKMSNIKNACIEKILISSKKITKIDKKYYKKCMKQIKIGQNENPYLAINNYFSRNQKKGPFKKFFEKIFILDKI